MSATAVTVLPLGSTPSHRTERPRSADEVLSRQIDELFRLSEEERDRQLGSQWFTEVNQFYSLTGIGSSPAPSFRPKIVLPELQTLMLAEATDISESSPKVFLLKKGERDKAREEAYQQHWRQQQYNLQIFVAELWSLFCGTGFLQVGVDPLGRRGRGEVWLTARDPSTCYPDPGTIDPERWVYSGWEDKLYLDEICRLWPDTSGKLAARAKGRSRMVLGSDDAGPGTLQLPEGPMRYGSGQVPQQGVTGDGRLIVRQLFINDYGTKALSEQEKKYVQDLLGPLGVVPERRLRYPAGRWVVKCEGVILADGDSWVPLRYQPLIPIQSMPRLRSFWVPPPVRYSKGLQELAERMLSGVFENATRLNNGVWFIDERTGIDPNDFGALPAEIRVIAPGSPPPEVKYGQPMPAHFTQLPDLLLAKQRMIQGFTPTRQGQPGSGNLGQDLFDASVFQSQVLTRMRAKLLAPSVQRVAELVFYTMMRYYTQEQAFPGYGQGDMRMSHWTPAAGGWESAYDIYLDPGSIRPLSASYLRSLVSTLLDKGHMPLGRALDILDIPDADAIAEERRKELELAAIAKTKRPR